MLIDFCGEIPRPTHPLPPLQGSIGSAAHKQIISSDSRERRRKKQISIVVLRIFYVLIDVIFDATQLGKSEKFGKLKKYWKLNIRPNQDFHLSWHQAKIFADTHIKRPEIDESDTCYPL